MGNRKKTLSLFVLGGSAYVGLELLYRRRSHISMFAAGGLCFLLLGRLRKARLPLPLKAAVGAGIITGVELGTGLLVNRDHHVWDYRRLPGNFKGQICPLFSAIWVPVSLMAMELYGRAEGTLDALRTNRDGRIHPRPAMGAWNSNASESFSPDNITPGF